MTTTTSPSEWFHQFYSHPNPAAPPPSTTTLSGQPSDATVVSTTITTNTATDNYSLGPMGLGGPDSFSGFSSALSPRTTASSGRPGPMAQESRVSRPARRRSRASRKNPTTLLNTDTTNFRAMVQRYTGGVASITYSPPAGFSVMGSGGGFHQGQMCNFNQLQQHGSVADVDPRASHLHQQLMQQDGYGSTADMSASSAGGFSSHVDPRAALQGSDHHLNNYSSSMGGSGENKRGGFMF